MTLRNLLILVLTCTLLSACAHHHMHRMRGASAQNFATCTGNTCNLKVEVVGCRIAVDPDALLILRRDNAGHEHRTHDLHWRLEGNYAFPANGIAFIDPPPGVFDGCAKQNDRHFFCRNVHRTGAYKYDVRVDGQCNGQPVPKKDPYIMND